MSKTVFCFFLSLAVAGFAGAASGQEEYRALNPEPDAYEPPAPLPEEMTDQPGAQDRPEINPNVYRNYIGRPVLTADGRPMGVVANFVFNTATDEVEAALVDTGEASGTDGRIIALPWDAVTVETGNNVLIADMGPSDIAVLEPFDPEILASPGYEALEEPLLDELGE